MSALSVGGEGDQPQEGGQGELGPTRDQASPGEQGTSRGQRGELGPVQGPGQLHGAWGISGHVFTGLSVMSVYIEPRDISVFVIRI